MATITTVKNRIVLMCSRVSGIVTSQDDYLAGGAAFTAAQLPAAITRPIQVSGRRFRLANGLYRVQRNFTTILHVSIVSTVSALTPDTTQMELCETYMDSVPDYFIAHPRLEDSDAGLVFGSDPMTDSGVIRIVREGVDYWGVVFTLPVYFIRP